MTKNKYDIAVVGAGPVGLAAALLLNRLGYRVALIAPRRLQADERTSALLAGSIALLDRIGVWPGLQDTAAPLRTLRLVDATDRLIRAPEVAFDASEIGLDAFGYNIPNVALLSCLDAAVEGSDILRYPASAEEVIVDSDGVRIKLSDGSAVCASLAVAADGRGSRTRATAGISVREWRYDQSALVVNLRHSRPHDDTSTEFHTPTGPFTLVPLPGLRSSLVWVGTAEETDDRLALSNATLAAAIERRSESILGAIEIDGRRQAFPLAGMTADRFASNRIALVGEAAHLFPPIGAQGLNLGYRDVIALGEVLDGPVADPGDKTLLAAFDRARRGDVLMRSAAVDALNRTLLTGFLPVQGLRGLGLFLLDRLPPLRRAVMRRGVAAGDVLSMERIDWQIAGQDQGQNRRHRDNRSQGSEKDRGRRLLDIDIISSGENEDVDCRR
jgi:2-octaprenyl-6-methoxyphenol hydroxylase